MSEQVVPLSPAQVSEVGIVPAEVPGEALPAEQGSSLDGAALLALAAITILYHALDAAMRQNSPPGLAFRDVYLRRVLTLVLAFVVIALVAGQRRWEIKSQSTTALRRVVLWISGGLLALFLLYVVSFVFLGLDILTDSVLPAVAEYAALLSVMALWQPWQRLAFYRSLLLGKYAPAVVIFVSVLVLWQFAIALFDIKQFLLPAPTVILGTFFDIYPRLVGQAWFTLQNALWGFAVGCSAGLLFGLISARFVGFSKAMLPYAVAANSIPIIAFAPIMNQWFGLIQPASKIAVVTVLTFFPVMINTVRGLSSVPPASLELMRSYAASEWNIFRKLRLPAALPYIFSALKVATTLAMIGAIVAEYFGGPLTGLGVHIKDDAGLSRFPVVWSEIIIASLLGNTFYFVVSLVERLVMPWNVAVRNQGD
ncbi:MAG TPA: ABC transporter permease [Aggregatilineales bacterium]|nr:ABC transporter permease [Aggregatilineales bacterium]